MEYVCVKFSWPDTENLSDIILANLSDTDFEMFEEVDNQLMAYIPKDKFAKLKTESIFNDSIILKNISIEIESIETQNWNQVWESNYESIKIGDEVYIRAPFHLADNHVKFELIIQPKMSFGTGHHDTTKLMIEYMLMLDIQKMHVLDMGSGTGVLAILADKMKASQVLAIDNDKNCIINAVENCISNKSHNVAVLEGDMNNLAATKFDIILANINKNAIIENLNKLSVALKQNAKLIISGFYDSDLKDIEMNTEKSNLKFVSKKISNNWCAALFDKK